MKLIQSIKQHFCHHFDEPIYRNHQVTFIGYIFQCPKCGAYVAYFQDLNTYSILSELQYNIIVEEGKKLWSLEHYRANFE